MTATDTTDTTDFTDTTDTTLTDTAVTDTTIVLGAEINPSPIATGRPKIVLGAVEAPPITGSGPAQSGSGSSLWLLVALLALLGLGTASYDLRRRAVATRKRSDQ